MGDDIKKVFERIEDALKDTGRDYMEENAPEPETGDAADKDTDDAAGRTSEKVYPCVPLRGVTIFPNTVIHFDIGRDKSIRALESGHEVHVVTHFNYSDYPDVVFADLGEDPVLPDPVDYVLKVEVSD